MSGTARHRVAVVGIGNDLAGDDGAGPEVVRLLAPCWQNDERVLLCRLEGDLLSIADLLPLADEFVFVDAVAGDVPGEIVHSTEACRAFTPSFHQTDVATVMRSLEALAVVEPFPSWDLWGTTILPPLEFRQGLSVPVAGAVRHLADELDRHLHKVLGG